MDKLLDTVVKMADANTQVTLAAASLVLALSPNSSNQHLSPQPLSPNQPVSNPYFSNIRAPIISKFNKLPAPFDTITSYDGLFRCPLGCKAGPYATRDGYAKHVKEKHVMVQRNTTTTLHPLGSVQPSITLPPPPGTLPIAPTPPGTLPIVPIPPGTLPIVPTPAASKIPCYKKS